MQKIIMVFIASTILHSCRLPCDTRGDLEIIDKKPKLNFLVGKYIVDYENKRGVDNTNDIKLNINADSTFILYNYPVGLIDLLDVKNEIRDTINGTWYSNYFDFNQTSSFSIFYNKGANLKPCRSWSVYKKDNKAVLVVEFDDPDQCYYMRFIKQ